MFLYLRVFTGDLTRMYSVIGLLQASLDTFAG
jgi:hypothetical protein